MMLESKDAGRIVPCFAPHNPGIMDIQNRNTFGKDAGVRLPEVFSIPQTGERRGRF